MNEKENGSRERKDNVRKDKHKKLVLGKAKGRGRGDIVRWKVEDRSEIMERK